MRIIISTLFTVLLLACTPAEDSEKENYSTEPSRGGSQEAEPNLVNS
jgi:hypothetical protein